MMNDIKMLEQNGQLANFISSVSNNVIVFLVKKHDEPASIVVQYGFLCCTICRSTIMTDTVEEYQLSIILKIMTLYS